MTKESDVNTAIILLIALSQHPRVQAMERLSHLKYFQMKPVGAVRLEAKAMPNSGNCAIPLLNALKGDKSKSNMPILKPQGEFKMPIISPIPVCENFGK
jgi:hypothetical protein